MVLLFLAAMYGVVAEVVPSLAPFRPAMALGLGALGILVVERTLSGRPFRIPWPEGHVLLAFIGAAGLSIANALWPRWAASNTIELAKLVVLYLVIVNVVRTRARLRGLMWTMVLAGSIPAWGTIQNYLTGNIASGRAAWIGIFANPNEVAFQLDILVPLALALMVTARLWGRLFLCATLAAYLMAIFVTYSRSGILALGALVVVGIFQLRSPALRALAVALVIVAVVVGPQFWERGESFENLGDDETLNSRLALNQKGFAMFQASPLFGIGIGNSALGGPEFAPDSLQNDYHMIHNTYVQALAETGLVGFTLFMFAILVVLRRMHRLRAVTNPADPELYAYATAIELSIVAFMACSLASGLLSSAGPYLLIALASATRGVASAEWESERG